MVQWRSWSGVAFAAAAISLMHLILRMYRGEDVLGFPSPLILAALLLFPLCAAFAWRSGDKRLIVSGCVMWIFPALAVLQTLLFVIGLAAR